MIKSKIKITQLKSTIKCPQKQKLTFIALGLKKINHQVEHISTPQIIGMIKKVEHLIKIE